jgi:fused signal recognition particle receptor
MNADTPRTGFLRRLAGGLARTASKLGDGLANLSKQPLDTATLQQLEDLLVEADLGVDTAGKVAAAMKRHRNDRALGNEEIRALVAGEIEDVLRPVEQPFTIDPAKKPFVVLVAGVNGSGKTTTIGKLAARLNHEGKFVMLAAADTFRAAAIEQLQLWGRRAGAEVVAREQDADPAGVAFEALERAKSEGADVLLVDTAGRLQNKQELMAELEKIVRVLKKQDESAPHATLLVLDATVGQNALSQVETFREVAGITGLVIAKLDGTAKGGILVALAGKFGLPVYFVGVGEAIEDLTPFDARAFAHGIVGIESGSRT